MHFRLSARLYVQGGMARLIHFFSLVMLVQVPTGEDSRKDRSAERGEAGL